MRCSARISVAIFSSDAASDGQGRRRTRRAGRAARSGWRPARRSRPRSRQTSSSIVGLHVGEGARPRPRACPPAIASRARAVAPGSARPPRTSTATLSPKVVGSAWIAVGAAHAACRGAGGPARRSAARSRSRPAISSRRPRASWSASAVSTTSEDVSPMWTKRESVPSCSSRLVRKRDHVVPDAVPRSRRCARRRPGRAPDPAERVGRDHARGARRPRTPPAPPGATPGTSRPRSRSLPSRAGCTARSRPHLNAKPHQVEGRHPLTHYRSGASSAGFARAILPWVARLAGGIGRSRRGLRLPKGDEVPLRVTSILREGCGGPAGPAWSAPAAPRRGRG